VFTVVLVPQNICVGSPQLKIPVRYIPSSHKEVNCIKIEVADESKQIR